MLYGWGVHLWGKRLQAGDPAKDPRVGGWVGLEGGWVGGATTKPGSIITGTPGGKEQPKELDVHQPGVAPSIPCPAPATTSDKVHGGRGTQPAPWAASPSKLFSTEGAAFLGYVSGRGGVQRPTSFTPLLPQSANWRQPPLGEGPQV